MRHARCTSGQRLLAGIAPLRRLASLLGSRPRLTSTACALPAPGHTELSNRRRRGRDDQIRGIAGAALSLDHGCHNKGATCPAVQPAAWLPVRFGGDERAEVVAVWVEESKSEEHGAEVSYDSPCARRQRSAFASAGEVWAFLQACSGSALVSGLGEFAPYG